MKDARLSCKVTVTVSVTFAIYEATASDGESASKVAEALGVSPGKVYRAGGRVLKILQREVTQFRHEDGRALRP